MKESSQLVRVVLRRGQRREWGGEDWWEGGKGWEVWREWGVWIKWEVRIDIKNTYKGVRLGSIFTDKQESAIVEVIKALPDLYTQQNAHFADRHWNDALWAEIGRQMNRRAIGSREWLESRKRKGKLTVYHSSQAPRELTYRQEWIW